MPLRQLPRNATDQTRVLVSVGGQIQNLPGDASLAALPFEHADPIREFFAWRHKRNYEGLWFSTTVGAHVPFESLLERQFLLSADHDPEIVGISAQPLAVLWAAGTMLPDNKRLTSHVPDFFCRYADGDGGLIDVRRPDRTDDPHFELTGRLCAELGWRSPVFTGLESPVAEALDWLAGYRMDRYGPAQEVRASILDSFSPETSLRSGVHAASRGTGLARDVLLGHVLHLLFHGDLHVDLSCLLTMDSTIRRDKEATA